MKEINIPKKDLALQQDAFLNTQAQTIYSPSLLCSRGEITL